MSTMIRQAWLALPMALVMIAGCGRKPGDKASPADTHRRTAEPAMAVAWSSRSKARYSVGTLNSTLTAATLRLSAMMEISSVDNIQPLLPSGLVGDIV